jgi:hypothetical protein
MKNCRLRIRFLALAPLLATSAFADPPEVKTLFPAGAQQGSTVEAAVSGKLDKGDRIWCSVGEVAAEPTEDAKRIRITVPAEAPPGICWLRAYNDDGASALRPLVIGTLAEITESEPNDALDKAHLLDSSQTIVNGVLSKAGEVDTFAVPLKSGETLVASITANATLGSPMDGVLQILGSDGFVLVQNDDDRGFDPQIIYTAEADGTYFVRLFAFPSAPNSSIRFAGGADYIYRLTLTTGPFADHAFPTAVTRGESAIVEPAGWNLTDEVREIPIAGEPVLQSTTVSHPALANTVQVERTKLPTAVESAPAGEAQPLEIPMCLSGRISEPGQRDVYALSAKKDDKLLIQVAAREIGSPLDPVLQIVGPDGKTIREVDDAGRNERDARYELKASADGEYRVEVKDLHSRGGFRYFYRLVVAPEGPAFTLQAEKDALRATPSKPAEIPLKIARTGGFGGEVEISITGLPEGVTVPTAKSEPKGESAKAVNLALNAPADLQWSGPIRITGRAPDGTAEVATFDLAGLGTSTSDLWLTLPGAD